MIYELINPSDALTFEAEDHRVAISVVLALGGGMYGAEASNGDKDLRVPILMFEGNTEAYLKKWFGEDDSVAWMIANKAAVIASLRGVLYSRPADRLESMLVADLEKSQDKKRTSANHIRETAFKIADGLAYMP